MIFREKMESKNKKDEIQIIIYSLEDNQRKIDLLVDEEHISILPTYGPLEKFSKSQLHTCMNRLKEELLSLSFLLVEIITVKYVNSSVNVFTKRLYINVKGAMVFITEMLLNAT